MLAASHAHVIQDLLEMELSVREQQAVKVFLATPMLCVRYAPPHLSASVFLAILEMDSYVLGTTVEYQLSNSVTVWIVIFAASMLVVCMTTQ